MYRNLKRAELGWDWLGPVREGSTRRGFTRKGSARMAVSHFLFLENSAWSIGRISILDMFLSGSTQTFQGLSGVFGFALSIASRKIPMSMKENFSVYINYSKNIFKAFGRNENRDTQDEQRTEGQELSRDIGETPGHMVLRRNRKKETHNMTRGHMVPVSLSTFVTILHHAWTQAWLFKQSLEPRRGAVTKARQSSSTLAWRVTCSWRKAT